MSGSLAVLPAPGEIDADTAGSRRADCERLHMGEQKEQEQQQTAGQQHLLAANDVEPSERKGEPSYGSMHEKKSARMRLLLRAEQQQESQPSFPRDACSSSSSSSAADAAAAAAAAEIHRQRVRFRRLRPGPGIFFHCKPFPSPRVWLRDRSLFSSSYRSPRVSLFRNLFPSLSSSSSSSSLSLPFSLSSLSATVLIFDWDDTLLCSTWLASEGLRLDSPAVIPPSTVAELQRLESSVVSLLERAMTYGEVVIITNAETGWVELSAQRFMPRVRPLVEKVRVISARSTYERQYPDNPYDWKVAAFRNEIGERVRRWDASDSGECLGVIIRNMAKNRKKKTELS